MIISSKKSASQSYSYEDDFVPDMTQELKEFDFLTNFLINNDVQSILIFGVDNAGMEYRLAETYSNLNKKCFITGLDCSFNDNLKHAYAKILGKFPSVSVNFVRLNLNMPFPFFLLGKYEFTFIDADHAYTSVKSDFALALKHTTRFVGFHDIVMERDNYSGPEGGVKKFWEETKINYKYIENVTEGSRMFKRYGIGIISL